MVPVDACQQNHATRAVDRPERNGRRIAQRYRRSADNSTDLAAQAGTAYCCRGRPASAQCTDAVARVNGYYARLMTNMTRVDAACGYRFRKAVRALVGLRGMPEASPPPLRR